MNDSNINDNEGISQNLDTQAHLMAISDLIDLNAERERKGFSNNRAIIYAINYLNANPPK